MSNKFLYRISDGLQKKYSLLCDNYYYFDQIKTHVLCIYVLIVYMWARQDIV